MRLSGKKVLFLTNYPAPYRVDFFNELGKRVQLTVVFEENIEEQSHRNSKWFDTNYSNFQVVFLNARKIKNQTISLKIIDILKEKYDSIIIGVYSTLTAQIAILYLRAKKIPFSIETDGGIAKNGDGIKEKWKKFLISSAANYFSPSEMSDVYLKHYGAKQNEIIRYPFSSLKTQDLLSSVIDFKAKRVIRQKLEMTEKNIVLTVGQFIPRKGNDVLIRAAKYVPDSVGIYFVGGEATTEYTDLVNQLALKNIHFVGFKTKKELKEYYLAADLFVMPTREDIWGLVINEALSNGLPVLSTDKCVAALELVKPGYNGEIIESDYAEKMGKTITLLFEKPDIMRKMAENAIVDIGNHTIEKMVEAHVHYFERQE